MRLINTKSLELKEFIGDPANHGFPRYAILSHTWGEEEVTLQEMQNIEAVRKKAGFQKITKCCETALNERLSWVWVDTCCIDKTSSAELSEAINSMFKWYEAATICYAYLSDVGGIGHDDWRASRWFTRGWTLQELVAPFEVMFYDSLWKQFGTKRLMTKALEQKTNIPEEVLLNSASRRRNSVAARMLWAKGRHTTRKEDRAYSLLGLFDINMPLLYGEGDKAFSRLHEEIMNAIQDDTIFLGGFSYEDSVQNQTLILSKTRGFLATPDNVDARLPSRIRLLPDSLEEWRNMTYATAKLYLLADTTGGFQRTDPRLRGNILSVHMRIIQVNFSKNGPAPVPITMKKQIYIEPDQFTKPLLPLPVPPSIKSDAASLCLGTGRCVTTDGRLVARCFYCFSTNNELWAYPLNAFRFISPAEVLHWPYMQCHIFLDSDQERTGTTPRLGALKGNFGNRPYGICGNGWSWSSELWDKGGDAEYYNTYKAELYQLHFEPNDEFWFLNIVLGVDPDNKSDFSVALKLRKSQSSISLKHSTQTVQASHGWREGPIVELCRRMPVLGGSAELVITVYCEHGKAGDHYYPMIRFRAFEPEYNADKVYTGVQASSTGP
ncbi:heterokaryon incompatibility protein-domain-containing protein [Xylariaceae sp. AK1471]|nr:heterokaryon incompatibility protein-domain-containing protein [Xylariaceae sp. AK1471]